MQSARGIGRQVTHIPIAADPDSAIIVHGQRTNNVRGQEYLSPGDAVILKDDAAGNAKVHQAAAVLQDGPHLGTGVVGPGRVALDHRHSGFCLIGRLGRGGLAWLR